MKGIEWAALPYITEMLGVDDVDIFITQLLEIRNFEDEKLKAERNEGG